MKVTPMLFSADMVRALLDGRKTQTRRIVKPFSKDFPVVNLAEYDVGFSGEFNDPCSWGYAFAEDCNHMPLCSWLELCPFGMKDDVIWVREAWRTGSKLNKLRPKQIREKAQDVGYKQGPCCPVKYLADLHVMQWGSDDFNDFGDFGRYRHSQFMLRELSRLTLKITDVRVERLQDISEEDSIAEGIKPLKGGYWKNYQPGWTEFQVSAKGSFCSLWNSINGNWDDNPWVWAVTFEVINRNIDEYLKEAA
jgi:hypothetical protein